MWTWGGASCPLERTDSCTALGSWARDPFDPCQRYRKLRATPALAKKQEGHAQGVGSSIFASNIDLKNLAGPNASLQRSLFLGDPKRACWSPLRLQGSYRPARTPTSPRRWASAGCSPCTWSKLATKRPWKAASFRPPFLTHRFQR